MVVHMNLIVMDEIRYGVKLYPINQSFFFFLGFTCSECLDLFCISSMPFSRFIIYFFLCLCPNGSRDWTGSDTYGVYGDPEFRSCRSPKRPDHDVR